MKDIVNQKWDLCQGRKLSDYLFLNDSFSYEGAFEIAVFRIKKLAGNKTICDQLDSIIVDLHKPQELQQRIYQAMNPDVIPYGEEKILVETPDQHARCLWCG